ncbi:MAG: sensor domain-containing diguanylate cyclase [Pseudomonadota bacterium]|uniref:sensor domain-containing diguanylate cyclase n=1 Tax=Hylemonella sp. TaxID=2066020 RepID=UPI0035B274C2
MQVAPALPARLRGLYTAVLLFLFALGSWLAWDLWRERERTMELAARLVMQKSQFMARAFGDTFLAADFVLRDVLGHVRPERDLVHPDPDSDHRQRIEGLLRVKAATIPVLEDVALFNHDCIFTAFAKGNFYGRRSTQRFCADLQVGPGERLHMQYLPVERSASKRPVVVMARTVGDAQGRLLGGAMAVLDLQYAQNWLASFDVDPQDNLSLLDTDGVLLARIPPLPQAIGQRLAPTPTQLPFSELVGVATFTDPSPVDGRLRVYGVSRLGDFPLVALVGFDRSTVLQGWRHRAWQLLAGYAVLCALTLLMLRIQLAMLRQREELRALATTDALTGIANRGQLMHIGAQEFARARRYGQPLSVLMLDIDRFKSVNDRWGHPTGDQVIRVVAQTLRSLARGQDLGGRLGGEEFALLLPATPLAGAWAIAERLRQNVQDSDSVRATDGAAVRFTVSIGVAALAAQDTDFDSLLQRADRALYLAKDGGRNRVELLDSDAAAGLG